jgi:UDP-N-acetylmuramate--alanine ligase
MSDRHEIIQYLLTAIIPGDLVITLGAGDIYRVGEDLVEELRRKYKAESR